MMLSLERMDRLLFGILTRNGAARRRIPRLDLKARNERGVAGFNLPVDVKSRFIGQPGTLRPGRRG